MTEPIRIKELTDDETVALNYLIEQLDEKTPRNFLRKSYYDGKRAIRSVGSVIPPQYEKLGIALGWTAKGVDGLGRRCNIDRFVWTDGDIDSLGIDELVDSNFLFSELAQGRTDSLINGVSYLFTTAGDESAGEPKALVHAKDALNATGEWNARRRALTSVLSVTDRDGEKITGFVLYLDNLTISATKSGNSWNVVKRQHQWHVPVDPLIWRPRASRRMGKSRITRPAMSHQDAAVRTLIRLEGHMDVYTIPKMILLGADGSIFKNADGSQKASWQVALGRVFAVPDDDDPQALNPRADVKQFDAQSPAPHISNLNVLAKLMARETDLPDADFALSDMANPTSDASYTASRENLMSEAEGSMDDWSAPIRRTVSRALAIQNGLSEIPKEWASLAPKWRSPIYVSRAAAADAGAKQLSAGPEWLKETDVGLELLGLDEQQIKRALTQKNDAERRAAGRAVIEALKPQQPVQANVGGA